MRLTGRTWGVLALIFAGGVALGLLLSRGETPRSRPSAKEAPKAGPDLGAADVTAQDIELIQGQAGQVQWRLKARGAEYNAEKGRILLTKPQMQTYVGEERREVFIQGERGEVDQQSNNLTLWDRVEGRYGEFALSAQSFDYIGAMNKVVLKGGVQVRRPDMSIDASAVEIDLNARQLLAAGGVTAYIAALPQGLPGQKAPAPQGTQP